MKYVLFFVLAFVGANAEIVHAYYISFPCLIWAGVIFEQIDN